MKECPSCSTLNEAHDSSVVSAGASGAHSDALGSKCPECGLSLSLRNSDDGRIIWRSNEGDAGVFAPFKYTRSLVNVPGISHPVTMNRRINQSVCEYIRRHFIPRDSDVWLVTYPKSGTTWVQNIISHLLFHEPNMPDGIGVGLTASEHVVWFEAQCTNEAVQEAILNSKSNTSAQCESMCVEVDITASTRENIDSINSLHLPSHKQAPQSSSAPLSPKPRCFKSHSPLGILHPLLTARGKIIHIARNPKDVSVSLWHHSRSKDFGYTGPFSHFLEEMFSKGHVESGDWWNFVIPYWLASKSGEGRSHLDSGQVEVEDNVSGDNECGDSCQHTNVLTLWYEDMILSPEENITKLAQFLNIQDISPDRIREISSLCSFESMKNSQREGGLVLKERTISASDESGDVDTPSCNQIRRGGVGGWKDYYSREQSETFDKLHERAVSLGMNDHKGYLGSCLLNANQVKDQDNYVCDNGVRAEDFIRELKWTNS